MSMVVENEVIEFCKFWIRDGLESIGVMKLHNYQKVFLIDCIENKRIAALWSRQIGKSTSISMYCLYMALTRSNFKIVIIAPTQRQSGELYNKVRNIAEGSCLVRDKIITSTQTEMTFINGSRIVSAPAGPMGDTIRGLTADIIVMEEAGGLKNSIVNEVIMPMIGSTQSYGQSIKIGTPKGKNHFWESCYGKETNYKLLHFDWKVAIEAGQYKQEFIDEQRRNLTELQFAAEYEAKFIEDSDCYFKTELIDSCIEDYPMGDVADKCLYYLGVDFARMGEDSCVMIVVMNKRGKLYVKEIIEFNKKKLTETIGEIKLLDMKYNFQKVMLDSTGLGAGPGDMLSEELGSWKVECVTFTNQSKQDMYSNLKKVMEQGRLKFTMHRKMYYEMVDLRYEISSSGNLKIHHPERGHDDYPDALALAVYSIYEDDTVAEYVPFIR